MGTIVYPTEHVSGVGCECNNGSQPQPGRKTVRSHFLLIFFFLPLPRSQVSISPHRIPIL